MEERPENSDPDALASRLVQLVMGCRATQALFVAASLGVPDQLANGPQRSEELAETVGAHPSSLRRLLRALTTIGAMQEREDGQFELTPMGGLLRRDAPSSLHSFVLYFGGYQWAVWGGLLESVRTGQSARKRLYGTEGFEHLEQDAELAALFNQAMVEMTRRVSGAVARTYDFSGLKRILDVGGGYGELLRAVLTAYPEAHGILFDMPHAMEQGQRNLAAWGLADRCAFVAGDFFESVPGDADAYLLKSVIHDWNDERAEAILASCRRAMPTGARLLLIERVMPERLGTGADDQAVAFSDLNMLVSLEAQERAEADFRRLLESAGLRLNRVIPTQAGFSILEAVA